jgi:hypothetical protein
MFYELNTFDPLGTTPWKRSSSGPLNGTFDGSIDALAQITLFVDPSATLSEKANVDDNTLTPFSVGTEIKSNTKPADTSNKDLSGRFEIPNILPDG